MRKLWSILPLALLIGVELLVVDPLTIVATNAVEFSVTAGALVPSLLLAAVGLAALILGVSAAVPERHLPRWQAMLLAVAVLLWVQRSFLLPDYGVFDGRGIDWSRFAGRGWIDVVVWLAGLALALRFAPAVARQATFVALALLLLQGGLTITHVFRAQSTDDASPATAAQAPAPGLFNWSRGTNVLHLILDSMQTDVFVDVVRAQGWDDELTGFRYFPENMGVAKSTSYSVPAVFSGEVYDGSEPFADYFGRAMGERSFVRRLDEEGFVVNLVPHLPMHRAPFDHYFTAPMIWRRSPERRRLQAAALAVDISLFRHGLHVVRPWVHADGDWRVSRLVGEEPGARSFHQKAFLRDYAEQLRVTDEAPRYHFLHLMPPHPPYVTRADGSYAGRVLESTRENFSHEIRGVVEIFLELLDRLRSEGLYDQALIVVHGDHGSRFAPVVGGREWPLPHERVPALLLLKLPGDREPFRPDPAWSSLADLPATILSALDLSHDYPGEDLSRLAPGPRGGRPFFVVQDPQAESPVVSSYRVRGSIYEPESWTVTSSREQQRTVGDYRWGDTIQFGVDGNAQRYQGRGWSQPSRRAEWTNGPRAELHLGIEPATQDMVLEIILRPFLRAGHVAQQRVGVELGDRRIADLVANEDRYNMLRARIPAAELQTRQITLVLRLPDCVSPVEIGAGGDRRQLGVSVGQIRLRPASSAD